MVSFIRFLPSLSPHQLDRRAVDEISDRVFKDMMLITHDIVCAQGFECSRSRVFEFPDWAIRYCCCGRCSTVSEVRTGVSFLTVTAIHVVRLYSGSVTCKQTKRTIKRSFTNNLKENRQQKSYRAFQRLRSLWNTLLYVTRVWCSTATRLSTNEKRTV